MRDKTLLAQYRLEQNGGVVDKEANTLLWDVIKLWREHFRGKTEFFNSNPLEFYSRACEMLGIGFEAYISLGASYDKAQPQNNVKSRFANKEDYFAELNKYADNVIDPMVETEVV